VGGARTELCGAPSVTIEGVIHAVQPPVSVPPGSLIAGRYAVEYRLGKGGMGSVYAVRDLSTGRRLALKCLMRNAAAEDGPERALFQREFHTLAHLRHPCVINVHDYGVAEGRPFYTMELLDGSDLRELAPLPWPKACSLLRDVASSLALLHSRRVLHRDLSPRNVRCTADGRAKLIDFGTMAPMGVARDVAGTAPYIAPEALHGQSIDARTDLYSLGALAYWMLTGYNAYPARDIGDLSELWTHAVPLPSVLAGPLPEPLDALIMSLLSLDPRGRPSHVTEVIERLSAIAGLEAIEQREVASAYLSTPTLVGHEDELSNFHSRLVRAFRGRGSSVLIRGPAGLGRSRLLQAHVLEAKLCGMCVLTADAEHAAIGELGVARQLLHQLIKTAPDLALDTFRSQAGVLGPLFPELLAKLDAPPPPAPAGHKRDRPARLMHAIRSWLLAVSEQRALMLAIDDLDHADEWSVVCLTMLAGDARVEHLVLAASVEDETKESALEVLAAESAAIDLAPLGADQSRSLLRSVFGDVAHLRATSDWIYAVAQGSPRTTIELAQYLIDHGIARHERGSWNLPESLREQALPASIEQALGEQVARLSAGARALAEALALVTEYGHLDLDELIALSDCDDADLTYRALSELIAARVVVAAGSIHALRQRTLYAVLHRNLDEGRRRALHLRLSDLYWRRPEGGSALLAAYHRYLAEDLDGCLALLAQEVVHEGAFARTPEAIAMFEACLAFGEAVPLAPSRLFPLRKTLLQLSSTADPTLIRYAEPTLAQLCHDSGRIYLERFRSDPDPLQRIRHCLREARQAYEQTAAPRRGLEPAEATYELAMCALTLTETYSVRNDLEGLASLPGLLEPFVPHSPVFELLHELCLHAHATALGRSGAAAQTRTLSRLELPLPGLDPAAQQAIRCAFLYWIGMDEAALGKPAALERALILEQFPRYAPLGAQIRAIGHLFLGDEVEAESWQRRRELLSLQTPFTAVTGARGIFYEGLGAYLCGSALGMRSALAAATKLAARFPGWQQEVRELRGLFELLRGELNQALSLLDEPDSAARVQALLAAGELTAARQVADEAFAGGAPRRDQPLHSLRLIAARALAWSATGAAERASEMLDLEIARAEDAGISGMLLCGLYEARARVAIELDDRATFRKYQRRLGAIYGRGASGLRARYEQLGHSARRAMMSVPPLVSTSTRAPRFDLESLYDPGQTRDERLQHALLLLARRAKSSYAFLYAAEPAGLRIAASVGVEPAPDGLDDMLGFYLNAELETNQAATARRSPAMAAGLPVDMVAWINDGQHVYYPLLLSCVKDQRRVVMAVAALALESQRDPQIPGELTSRISRALLETGDLIGLPAPV
jgi:hypothetical protein